MYFRQLQNYTGDFLLAYPVAKLIHTLMKVCLFWLKICRHPQHRAYSSVKNEKGTAQSRAGENQTPYVQSLAGEMLEARAALMLCPQFWLATSVSSSLFLLEQNKEVHVLF